MRTTRATAAVERLKTRSGNAGYAMVSLSGGLLQLVLKSADGTSQKVAAALPLDDFVRLVDGIEAAKPRKLGKLDEAFEKQLVRK